MKAVVAREVSALVLKPAAIAQTPASRNHTRFDNERSKSVTAESKADSGHARYYGMITLNQVTLTSQDKGVAGRMIELYFEVFREILGDGMKTAETDELEVEGEEVIQKQVEKVTGRIEKWRGRRKGTKPKGGKKTALENEELIETGESKLVAAILTGINRALPFAEMDDDV